MLSFITSCNRDSVKTDNIIPNKSIASQSLESRSTPNPYNAGLSDNELKVITFLGDHKDFIEMVQNQFAFEHIMIKPLLDKGDAKELKEAKDNPQKAKIFIDKNTI